MTKRIIPLFLIILLVACGRDSETAVKPSTVQIKTIPIVTVSSSESLTDVIAAAVAEVAVVETTAVASPVDSHLAKNNIKQVLVLDMPEPVAEVTVAEDGLVAVTGSGPVVTTQDAGSTTVTESVSVVGETAVTNDTPISQPQPPAPQPADDGNTPPPPPQPAPPSNMDDNGDDNDNSGPGNNHDDDDDDNSGPGNNHDDDDDDDHDDND